MIMFSPYVFVCVCVCLSVYACHDVCPDDLTMKDWSHTKNILQMHCWWSLVVQVMFQALMTSLMTPPRHKVAQIVKLIYRRQYLSQSVDHKLKMSEMLMATFLVYSASGITSAKKFITTFFMITKNRAKISSLNFLCIGIMRWWLHLYKCIIKTQLQLASDMNRSSQIMPKSVFHDDNVIDDVTGWPQNRPYIFHYKWNNNISHDN